MSTFYLDYLNGNDANSGADWANAWKTITSGATAARIAPGDIVRIAKSPDPVSVGDGKWTSLTGVPATKNISSSTNATPIVMTVTSHGYSNNDIIQVVSHTVNTNANGAWKIANVTANTFELVDSVGNGVGAASGTVRNINYKSILLTTPQAKPIFNCGTAFTAAGSSTCSTTTVSKEGAAAATINKTSPATNTLYGYKTITSVDLSTYQNLTFWLMPSVVVTAGQWKVTLCSDTSGTIIVDTFELPAMPQANYWYCLTLPRTGGGNLGSAIQSIGVQSGGTTPATITLRFDNICVSTTGGLSLNTLISQNSNAQGGSEPWLPIQSINGDGSVLLIDGGMSAGPTSTPSLGYIGTTGTVTTYIRETIQTVTVASGANSQAIQDSGTLGNLIYFEGGYNTSSSVQDGETVFDGTSGLGYGLNGNSKSFYKLNYLSFTRYDTGIKIGNGTGIELGEIGDLNGNNGYGLDGNTSVALTASLIRNICNNGGSSILISLTYNWDIAAIGNLNSTTGSAGLIINTGYNLLFRSIGSISGNASGGINVSGGQRCKLYINNLKYNVGIGINHSTAASYDNNIYNMTMLGNTTSGVQMGSNVLSLHNCVLGDSTPVASVASYQDSRLNCFNYGGTTDDHRIFTDNGSIVTDSTTRHTASDFSWKSSPTTLRKSWYPLKLKIAEIACNSGSLVTFKAWVKLDHATDIASAIVCPGGQVGGVTSDQIANKAADTSWEELTITFTPTENKVVEIYQYSWYVAGNSSAYVDDITVTQA